MKTKIKTLLILLSFFSCINAFGQIRHTNKQWFKDSVFCTKALSIGSKFNYPGCVATVTGGFSQSLTDTSGYTSFSVAPQYEQDSLYITRALLSYYDSSSNNLSRILFTDTQNTLYIASDSSGTKQKSIVLNNDDGLLSINSYKRSEFGSNIFLESDPNPHVDISSRKDSLSNTLSVYPTHSYFREKVGIAITTTEPKHELDINGTIKIDSAFVSRYYKTNTDSSFTIPEKTSYIISRNNSRPWVSGTITFPETSKCPDGQVVHISGSYSSITLQGNIGQTVINSPSPTSLRAGVTYIFTLGNETWEPVN